MMHHLEPTFRELGLTQYLDAFVDQGFDTWDTILDIQESDLDALGVKLGHRRKLQRRIANARGIAPSVCLPSPVKPSPSEEAKSEGSRSEQSKSENGPENGGVVKRKYRRHPKPDENAPERPPSAYVLFSNKMREDLKSQSLTFTEIAKLVGENWQNLAAADKEAYESQANAAKEKYHRDLQEYKKTPEYRRYSKYLQEFKEKQARQSQDSSKRQRVEPAKLRHGSSSSSTPGQSNGSGNGVRSGSDRPRGSEPPPNREERTDSTASMTESQYSNAAPTLSQRSSLDEAQPAGLLTQLEAGSRNGFPQHHRRPMSISSQGDSTGRQPLPPLSDMLDGPIHSHSRPTPVEMPSYGGSFAPANRPRGMHMPNPNSTGPPPRVPFLRHEPSSTGSSGSISSASSYARTPGEGPVPIHTLLSERSLPSQSLPSQVSTPASSIGMHSPTETSKMSGTSPASRGYGFQSGPSVFQNMKTEQSSDGDVLMTSVEEDSPPTQKRGLDGMNALLRAGEIVSRSSLERGGK